MPPRVLFQRAADVPADWPLPSYATEGSAGFDLPAYLPEYPTDGPGLRLRPGCRVLVRTGWCIAVPQGYEAQVRGRGGWAAREGVVVLNAPGTVDCDFRGEMLVLLHNSETVGPLPFASPFSKVEVHHRARIAQVVIAPVVRAELVAVDALPETLRGAGGWGSTGR